MTDNALLRVRHDRGETQRIHDTRNRPSTDRCLRQRLVRIAAARIEASTVMYRYRLLVTRRVRVVGGPPTDCVLRATSCVEYIETSAMG